MSYNSKHVGVVIGRLRIKKGLSQERFSGLAGISRSHLADIENGKKIIRLDTLWKIAEALDIEPHELIGMIECEKN